MRYLRICLLAVLAPVAGVAQEQEAVEFSGHTWTVAGDVSAESYMGHEALRMRNGVALLHDVEFEDGTVEFDFVTAGYRGFFGINLRSQDGSRFSEYFYIRPHQSKRFDALQYIPVFNGLSTWQLYPEYNAGVDIPQNRWVHVRLVVVGERMDVFFDEATDPVMVVEHLVRGRSRGELMIRASSPAGGGLAAPEGLQPTAFANFVVRASDVTTRGGEAHDEEPADPRLIGSWALSPSFAVPGGPIDVMPSDAVARDGWVIAQSDARGRVNIGEHRAFPDGVQRAAVLARVVIRSDRDQVKKLNFGFSDEATVFLNGQPVYSADNGYLTRSERYLGVMNLENDALYLSLMRGDNELIVAVTENFGGWGVNARLANLEGIEVVAVGR